MKEVSVPPTPTVAGRRECLQELMLDDSEVMDQHPLVTLRITWLSGMSALLAGLPKHRAPAWFQYVLARTSRHPFLMKSGVDRALACWLEWQLNQGERFRQMTGMSKNAFINTKNRSHTMTAKVEIPEGGAEGVIYNFLGLQRFNVAAEHPLPPGKATIRYEFASDGTGIGKGGMGTLLVNEQKIAEARIERTQCCVFSADEGADVGMDEGTPSRRSTRNTTTSSPARSPVSP